jgi:hypothetical protein
MQRCPHCGAGELKIIAAILERPVIEKILAHLGLDPQLPSVALRAVNVQRPANSPAPSLQTPGLRAESARTCVLRPSAGSAERLFRPILAPSYGV